MAPSERLLSILSTAWPAKSTALTVTPLRASSSVSPGTGRVMPSTSSMAASWSPLLKTTAATSRLSPLRMTRKATAMAAQSAFRLPHARRRRDSAGSSGRSPSNPANTAVGNAVSSALLTSPRGANANTGWPMLSDRLTSRP